MCNLLGGNLLASDYVNIDNDDLLSRDLMTDEEIVRFASNQQSNDDKEERNDDETSEIVENDKRAVSYHEALNSFHIFIIN